MSTAREELERILTEREGELAADGFAEVVEGFIEFGETEDDYFSSLQLLPSPLAELYATLIFNSNVRFDGLPAAILYYHKHPEFMLTLQQGLNLLKEQKLWSLIKRASAHLHSDSSNALSSKTPNVTFDQEVPKSSNKSYFAQAKQLMPKIGAFLHANREQVLAAASRFELPPA